MKKISVFLTQMGSRNKLTPQQQVEFAEKSGNPENNLIRIYDDVEYQEILGFGGALTESAGYCYSKLSEENKKRLIEAYFDRENGIGYNFCRTHMNSCDFSLGNYSCCENESMKLEGFNIERDKEYIIPLIKAAQQKVDFKLLVSPWSQPSWMKTTGKMNYGGKLKKEYYDAWAMYYVKFIKTYRKMGIDTFAITVQNEPNAVQTWDSCTYTGEEERDFVKNHLGPTLKREDLSDVKIFIWDHNKERVYERSKIVYDDAEAEKYVSGTAFHWYSGDHFENLEMTHKRWPDKMLILSECCVEASTDKGAWFNAERYAHDIIGNLQNYMNGWIDWNIVLDEHGGPNHVGNFCDAPIRMDTQTGEMAINPSYYYIGHFSKFITPGSRRIGISRFTDKLECCAFKTIDGNIVVVVLNRNEEQYGFYLDNGNEIAGFQIPARAIMTLVY